MSGWKKDEDCERERYYKELGAITLEVMADRWSEFYEKSLIVTVPFASKDKLRIGELNFTLERAMQEMDELEDRLRESLREEA